MSSETAPSSFENADFSGSRLSDLIFYGADLRAANFADAILEGVRFDNADLSTAIFRNAFVVDVDFSGSILKDADFTEIDQAAISIILESEKGLGKQIFDGLDALGYLRFQGAKTDEIRDIYVLQHHPAFSVVDKIMEKLAQQTVRQRRGLEQRGAARQDVKLARDFVKYLENKGFITTPKNRKDMVEVTELGRKVFSKYAGEREFVEDLKSFFRARSLE